MSDSTSEEDSGSINSDRLEQSYLGNILLSYQPPASYFELPQEAFSTLSHQLIYRVCKAIVSNDESPAPAVVVEALREEGSLQTAGGEDYIYSLLDSTNIIDAMKLENIRDSISKHHRLRLIASTANAAMQAARGADGDLNYAEAKTRDLLKLLETRKKSTHSTTSAFQGITFGAVETFRPAVKTGWKRLDQTVRMSPGRLIVLGARPGIGKTTLSVQLASQVLCMNENAHVLYCSVEMDAAEIGLKSLSMLTSTDCVTPFQESDAEKIEWVMARAGDKSPIIERLHVFYGTRLDKLTNIANKLAQEKELKLVVCDFISSMKPIGEFGTRTEAIGSISKCLKAMAKQLGIPVLACSQLNRNANANKRPSMKDLRDSGEIEQDADIVLLLHRNPDDPDETSLLVEKNRFGILSEMRLEPDLKHHRFRLIDYHD